MNTCRSKMMTRTGVDWTAFWFTGFNAQGVDISEFRVFSLEGEHVLTWKRRYRIWRNPCGDAHSVEEIVTILNSLDIAAL